MRRIVVMLFCLFSGISHRFYSHFDAERPRRVGYTLGQFVDAEGFGKLVEDAQLALIGWVLDRQFDAVQRVLDVQITASLSALAVNGQWKPLNRLHHEAVEHGPEDL